MSDSDGFGLDEGAEFELDERFADWVDGRLTPPQLVQLEDEMRRDSGLRAAAEDYRATVGLLRAELPGDADLAPPEDLIPGVLEQLVVARRPRRFGPLLGSLIAAAAMISLVFVLWDLTGPAGFEHEGRSARRDAVVPDARPEMIELTPAVEPRGSVPVQLREDERQAAPGKSAGPTSIPVPTTGGPGTPGPLPKEKSSASASPGRAGITRQAGELLADVTERKFRARPKRVELEQPENVDRQQLDSLRKIARGYLDEVATLEELLMKRPVATPPVRSRLSRDSQEGGARAEGEDDDGAAAVGQAGKEDAKKVAGRAKAESRGDARGGKAVDLETTPVLLLELPAGSPATGFALGSRAGLAGLSKFFASRESPAGGTPVRTRRLAGFGQAPVATPARRTGRQVRAPGKAAPSTPGPGQVTRKSDAVYARRIGDEAFLVQGDQEQLQRFFVDLRGYLARQRGADRSEQGNKDKGSPGRAALRLRVQRSAGPAPGPMAGGGQQLRFVLVLRRQR